MRKFKYVNRLNTYSTQWDYRKDRFNNDQVIPFSISDMDIRMPENVISKIKAHIDTGVLGYSRWAHDDLFLSIKAWYLKQFKCEINSSWITYSPSVTHSLKVLFKLLDSKNILVLTPCYDGFLKVINSKFVNSPLVLKDNEYKINEEDFLNKISKVDTFLFCNPHNPVGKSYDLDEIEFIVKSCKENNIFIISDEIHMDFVFKKIHIPILDVCSKYDYLNKTIITTSASKTFNFPALNFSYNLIPDELIKNKFLDDLKISGLSSCSVLGLVATIEAYNNSDVWLNDLKMHLMNNLNYLNKILKNTMLVVNNIDATYLVWIDVSYYKKDFDHLLDIMYNEEHVGIMSGSTYLGDFHLRINIGCDFEKLEEGLKRLLSAIKKLHY